MKQSCVLIFTLFWGLRIWGVRGGNKLMDLGTEQTKRIGTLEHSAANPNVLNSAMNRLRNDHGIEIRTNAKEKDKTPTADDSRFFYTGIDWTINLLPSIILIKLAFLGGWVCSS